MLLSYSPWCQISGIKPFLRRPRRRTTLRWVQVVEPMEIRTVLSAANLTAQMMELAVPTYSEAASTNLRADEFDLRFGQASVDVPQVSIDPPAVVMSLAVIRNGHDFESESALSPGRVAIHGVFAVVDFEPLTWSISFISGSGRNIDDALKSRFVTVSRSFTTEVVRDSHLETGRVEVDARSSGLPRVVSEASPPSSTEIFTVLSPSRLRMSDQTILRDNGDDDSRHDRDNVVVDRIMMERLLENLTLRRSNRLIDGPIGDRDGRMVRLLDVPTVQSALPPLAPLTLPTWDSELLIRARPVKPGQQVQPDQPNQSDQNSPDEKKTTNGKVQDQKKRDNSHENKRNPTDGEKDDETEAEGNSAAPTMSAAPRSGIKPIWAFLAARHSGRDDTTATQSGPSHETSSRSWWESCMDPTAWLAGLLSLSSFAAVWQDNRKRDVTDAARRR